MERRTWTIPPEKSKAGEAKQQAHDVPLSSGAIEILSRMRKRPAPITNPEWYLFPAATASGYMDQPKGTIKLLKQARKLPDDFMLHPIRATVAQRMKADLDVPPYVVEAILGHAVPTLAQVYMPAAPWGAMVHAMEKWSDEVARILGRAKAERSGS
jgi:integrase